MKNGYALKWGPFELIDKLDSLVYRTPCGGRNAVPTLLEKVGDGSFYRIEGGQLQYFGTDGSYHDVKRAEGVLLLSDIKRSSERVAGNGSASLWDIGDKVLCLEFHSKMNAVDEGIMMMASHALKIIPAQGYEALVIHNEGTTFSGANVGLALFAANIAAWPKITEPVKQGQDVYKNLKFAPFLSSAPSGMALGGGREILLHCDALEAHAETYMGLVEVGVGLVPAWGGCKEMLLRWSDNPKHAKGPMPAVSKVFETVATATVAKSAEEAPQPALPAARRRHCDEPRSPAGPCQRAGAIHGERLGTSPEPRELRLPGPSGEVRHDAGAQRLPACAAKPPSTT